MIVLETARSGAPTASVDGRWIHSRYDPRIEAERFLERESREPWYRSVLVLGDGLGYLVEAARARFPTARIVWISYHPDLLAHRVAEADHTWSAPEGVDRFLDQVLDEEDSVSLLVLAWEPGARAVPERASRCLNALHALLERRSAVRATEGFFGSRWLRNAIRNALAVGAAGPNRRSDGIVPSPGECERVVIAAAGPTLTRSLESLYRVPDEVPIWALPSAVSILLHAGIHPDLVVTTDGGAYAVEHLKPLRSLSIPIAAPLSAALDRPETGPPLLILDQGNWFERDLVSRLGVPSIAVPPHGTVAGTAWYLARALGVKLVYFAGLDLCSDDLLAHPKGHSFERLLNPAAGRTAPLYTTLFRRVIVESEPLPNAPRARVSRSMRVYARWFQHADPPTPAVRVAPSPLDLGLPVGELPQRDGTVRRGEGAGSRARRRSTEHNGLNHRTGNAGGTGPSAAVIAGWYRALECLPAAIRSRDRSTTEQLACDIARMIAGAHYLRVLRSPTDESCRELVGACRTALDRSTRRIGAVDRSGGQP